ncbi:hypothetical protein ACSHWB_38570 [Lentzea sp. HUAS TT2]|uniref:hypothetical protein n=1 Tax=Lentzea sp. HUAS TT2 TaxID=3447454 RepID=UPI003F6FE70C
MGFSGDEDVVEHLAQDGADDAFAVGVRPGCLRRALDHAHLAGFEAVSNASPYLLSWSRSRKRIEAFRVTDGDVV